MPLWAPKPAEPPSATIRAEVDLAHSTPPHPVLSFTAPCTHNVTHSCLLLSLTLSLSCSAAAASSKLELCGSALYRIMPDCTQAAAVIYRKGFEHRGHVFRLPEKNPVSTQPPHMKCPFSQVFPPERLFFLPQLSQTLSAIVVSSSASPYRKERSRQLSLSAGLSPPCPDAANIS